MATRKLLAMLVAAASVLEAPEASAKVYVQLRPRATLVAGYDDNVQLDGSGADSFGQAVPGLKLDVFGEHQLHLNLDCQAGVAKLLHPERFQRTSATLAANESCVVGFRDRLSARTTYKMNLRATYAQDPFAIAGLGLLLRPGQTQVFTGRFGGEIDHAISARSQMAYMADAQMLNFGADDPGNGYLVTPQLRFLRRTSARATWDLGLREQLFIAQGSKPKGLLKGTTGGLLDESHAALLGVTYKLSQITELIVRGGPMLTTGQVGNVFVPVGRVELEAIAPTMALHMTLAHDLVIGASTAGPLVGDIAEVGVTGQFGRFGALARAGVYRNAVVVNALSYSAGYGAEVAMDYAITKEFKIGVAALRDARLSDFNVAQKTDRDVVQLRLTWERARPD